MTNLQRPHNHTSVTNLDVSGSRPWTMEHPRVQWQQCGKNLPGCPVILLPLGVRFQ